MHATAYCVGVSSSHSLFQELTGEEVDPKKVEADDQRKTESEDATEHANDTEASGSDAQEAEKDVTSHSTEDDVTTQVKTTESDEKS